ncbi:hypothetical protein Q3G72_022559 [Acer saccharum]|nr:hypothetical protein Q3G72_022559 [Acer saccharum]
MCRSVVVECYFYILLNLNSNWKRNCPILYHDELVSLPTPSGIRCASSQIISEQLGQYLPLRSAIYAISFIALSSIYSSFCSFLLLLGELMEKRYHKFLPAGRGSVLFIGTVGERVGQRHDRRQTQMGRLRKPLALVSSKNRKGRTLLHKNKGRGPQETYFGGQYDNLVDKSNPTSYYTADPSELAAADSETTPDLENETRTFKWGARQEQLLEQSRKQSES